MKLKDFENYLACYGADLNAWPEALAKEARQLFADSESFKKAWEEAKRLEQLMSTAKAPELPEDFTAEIVARASLLPQESIQRIPEVGLKTWWQRLWRPLPALALTTCLLVGILAGLYTQNPLLQEESNQDSGTEWAQLLYTEESMLWDENSN